MMGTYSDLWLKLSSANSMRALMCCSPLKKLSLRFLPDALTVIMPFAASAVHDKIAISTNDVARVVTFTAFMLRIVFHFWAISEATSLGASSKSIITKLSCGVVNSTRALPSLYKGTYEIDCKRYRGLLVAKGTVMVVPSAKSKYTFLSSWRTALKNESPSLPSLPLLPSSPSSPVALPSIVQDFPLS